MNDKRSMTFDEFAGIFMADLRERMAAANKGEKLWTKKMPKVNQVKTAILVDGMHPLDNVVCSPCVYMEDYYEEYTKGKEIAAVVSSAMSDIGSVSRNTVEGFEALVGITNELEAREQCLFACVINFAGNEEYLSDKVYRRFEDLAVIYRVMLNHDNDVLMTTVITKEIAKDCGMSVEELDERVVRNTFRILGTKLEKLDDMLRAEHERQGIEYFPVDLPAPMYCMTTEKGIFGAVQLLNVDALSKLSAELEDDLLICPSSIHESATRFAA